MLRTELAPLRASVGPPLRITAITLTAQSPLLDPTRIRAVVRNAPAEVGTSGDHVPFLPPTVLLEGGQAPLLAPEAGQYAVPSDLPFPATGGFASIYIEGPAVENVLDSRKLWAEFEIAYVFEPDIKTPGKPVVPRTGGVVFGGLPYLPSCLNAQGEPSANHGLPREMRLSWHGDDAGGGGFIDDEMSVTRQAPAWHSNSHVLEIGPLVADRLRLRVSDLPRLLGSLRSWDAEQGRYVEKWAAVIPFLYVFQYREGTRYGARLPAGIVSAVQSNAKRPRSFFAPALVSPFADAWRGAESTYLHLRDNAQVLPFTPQSATLPLADRRRYVLGAGGAEIEEFYISNVLPADERLWITLAQRCEHERTLAGLRLEFGPSKLGAALGVLPGRPLRLRVWEVDRLPGAAVADIAPDLLRDKYSRLLADTRLADTRDAERTVRFDRPTLARHLCLEFEAEQDTQVSLRHLGFVQSAAISVAPRTSRSQMLRTLHFRLVGRDLGADLAALGNGGFHLSVDRVVAGQVRERLFHAHSLEGLIRSGSVRLMANSRSRAVERQTTHGMQGFTETRSESRNDGWNRSESGAGITAPAQWSQGGARLAPDGEHGFRQLRSEEARVHVRHVANVPNSYRNRILTYFPHLAPLLAPSAELLRQDAQGNWWLPWRATTPARQSALAQALQVAGLLNVSLPPYHAMLLSRAEAHGGLHNITAIQTALSELTAQLFVTNGAGIGASMGFSAVVANWNWSNNISASGVASSLSAHSMGTTGSITRSAFDTDYTYAQSRTAGASEAQTRTAILAGDQEQILTRSEVPGPGDQTLRLRGAEVMWNGAVTDVAIGQISLGVNLPATNEPAYRTTDDAIRVSFGRPDADLMFDVWFEIAEEVVRDDY